MNIGGFLRTQDVKCFLERNQGGGESVDRVGGWGGRQENESGVYSLLCSSPRLEPFPSTNPLEQKKEREPRADLARADGGRLTHLLSLIHI